MMNFVFKTRNCVFKTRRFDYKRGILYSKWWILQLGATLSEEELTETIRMIDENGDGSHLYWNIWILDCKWWILYPKWWTCIQNGDLNANIKAAWTWRSSFGRFEKWWILHSKRMDFVLNDDEFEKDGQHSDTAGRGTAGAWESPDRSDRAAPEGPGGGAGAVRFTLKDDDFLLKVMISS